MCEYSYKMKWISILSYLPEEKINKTFKYSILIYEIYIMYIK